MTLAHILIGMTGKELVFILVPIAFAVCLSVYLVRRRARERRYLVKFDWDRAKEREADRTKGDKGA